MGRPLSAVAIAAFVLALPVAAIAQSASGTLRIKTDVPQVQAFLDGTDVGLTPLTLTGVASGKHSITLSKPGWIDHIDSVAVEQGKIVSVFVIMKKLDTPMPAVPVTFRGIHAHAVGQCVGSLIVQKDSILFRADDGQDVFTIPIRTIRMVARGSGVNWWALSAQVAMKATLRAAAAMPIEDPSAGASPLIPLRVETPDRNYSFLAFESGDNTTAIPKTDMLAATVAVHNQTFFEVVYRLYLDDLKAR